MVLGRWPGLEEPHPQAPDRLSGSSGQPSRVTHAGELSLASLCQTLEAGG